MSKLPAKGYRMDSSKSTITLTFGDSAENHVGMEKIGTMVPKGQGFQIEELETIMDTLSLPSVSCHLYMLDRPTIKEEAAVLVIHNAVNAILAPLGKTKEDLFQEQAKLDQDKKALMYGRVVNKNARWNLCFDDIGHQPSYEEGLGRVVPYTDVPLTNYLRQSIARYFGAKASGLKCEGNYYYDTKVCGIGFHGDSERRKVIGVRLGASLPMHWQWFYKGEPVEERFVIPLDGGDLYIMSEKAVGTDWKMKTIPTLRHATGSAKFTTIV